MKLLLRTIPSVSKLTDIEWDTDLALRSFQFKPAKKRNEATGQGWGYEEKGRLDFQERSDGQRMLNQKRVGDCFKCRRKYE